MRFYVYELIDPRRSEVFYVGKGQNKRLECHERDAARGDPGDKCDRIRDIWASGLSVDRRIVKRFSDEHAAYAFERSHIASLEGLTNIAPGGNGSLSYLHGWSPTFLNYAAPTLARVLKILHSGQRFVVGGDVDATVALKAFVKGAIESAGLDAVAKAVLPYGVQFEKQTDFFQ